MARVESAIPIISQYASSSSSSSSSSSCSRKVSWSKALPSAVKLRISFSSPLLFLSGPSPNCSSSLVSTKLSLNEEAASASDQNQKRKLYIFNLPWSLSVAHIKDLFGHCGTVTDVEIIKHKNGRSRGFAFLTMASPDQAQAAIHRFNSPEISGRVIQVEFAKRLKKPPPPGETVNKLYVSNLAWKVRSSDLRQMFSQNFNPIAARVVFDSPSGRSAGYGFVSFATREEAQTALSSLEGKELMGRPLRLKFSERNTNESQSAGKEETVESHPEES